MRLILVAAAITAFAPAAVAQGIYKYTDPSGRVTYTDKPPAGDAQPLDIRSQPGGQSGTGLSEAEKKLLEQANERTAKLDRATDDVVAAFNALRGGVVRSAE